MLIVTSRDKVMRSNGLYEPAAAPPDRYSANGTKEAKRRRLHLHWGRRSVDVVIVRQAAVAYRGKSKD